MPALATRHRQLSLLELLAIVTMCSLHMGLIAADAKSWAWLIWLMLAYCIGCLAMMQWIPSQLAASKRMARIFLVFAFLSVVSLTVMDLLRPRHHSTKRPEVPLPTPPNPCIFPAPFDGSEVGNPNYERPESHQ